MRLILAGCLATTAFAGIANIQYALMQTGLFKPHNREKRALADFEEILTGTGINLLDGYGCWCYFTEETFGLGRGEPKDETDKMCRVLAKSYQCAALDELEDADPGEICKPWSQVYVAPEHLYANLTQETPDGEEPFNDDDLNEACREANPDDECAFRTCSLDSKFVSVLYKKSDATLSWENILDFDEDARMEFYDESNQHGGNWDRNGNCPSRPSMRSGDRSRECCGRYPSRFPYFSAQRGCCDEKSYVRENKSCCGDEKTEGSKIYKPEFAGCCGQQPFLLSSERICVADQFLVNGAEGEDIGMRAIAEIDDNDKEIWN